MICRAIVGFGRINSWKGIYIHNDGNPSALGRTLVDLWYSGDLTWDFFQQHPGGFVRFPDECFCHGPHSKEYGSCAKDSPDYRLGYPNMLFTNLDFDPMNIKWIYLVDPPWVNLYGGYQMCGRSIKKGSKKLYRTYMYDFLELPAVHMPTATHEWSTVEYAFKKFLEKRK